MAALLTTRRRFLTISACALATPALAAREPVATWRGVAMGAGASLTIRGMEQDAAAPLIAAVTAEIARLEGIFSLYKEGSELARLNRNGALAAPSFDMLDLLGQVTGLHAATGGAFDPTVQPLWALYAEHAGTPPRAALDAVMARTGWNHVQMDSARVAFAKPDMAMTLNGIAQGYVTDRVAALLRQAGLTDVLVNMGETHALGGPFTAGIASPTGALAERQVVLSDRALATSAPLGTLLDADGQVGHIIDPRTGLPAARRALVSVSAPRATLADGLSTAFCIMDDRAIDGALARYSETRVEYLA